MIATNDSIDLPTSDYALIFLMCIVFKLAGTSPVFRLILGGNIWRGHQYKVVLNLVDVFVDSSDFGIKIVAV